MSSPDTSKAKEGMAPHPASGTKAQANHASQPHTSGNAPARRGEQAKPLVKGLNGGHKINGKIPGQAFHYQTERSSRGSKLLYITGAAVGILLVAAYAVYTSTASKRSMVFPVRAGEETFVAKPVVAEQSPPKPVAPPPKPVVKRVAVAPNAVIVVPSVGMRSKPDISAKVMPGPLKRGERVEIMRRQSGHGPSWVMVKTKLGKVGWVFASVVHERRSG